MGLETGVVARLVALAVKLAGTTYGAVSRGNRRGFAKRAARIQRFWLHARLRLRLHHSGFDLARYGPRMPTSHLKDLQNSITVKRRSVDQRLSAEDLIDLILNDRCSAFVLEGRSGLGKTTFVMSLAIRLPGKYRRGVVAHYVNVSDHRYRDRLAHWLAGLQGAARADLPPKTRLVLFLDGINETEGPQELAQTLSVRRPALEELGVKVVLISSFRHRSRADELLDELTRTAQFARVELLDLEPPAIGPFAAQAQSAESGSTDGRGLDYFPGAIPRIAVDYADLHPDWRFSRRDVAAVMRWCRANPSTPVDEMPVPATLIAVDLLGDEFNPRAPGVRDLALAAFAMLANESTSILYRDLSKLLGEMTANAARTRIKRGLEDVSETHLSRAVVLGKTSDPRLIIDSERAVRVLASLHAAGRLLDGATPPELRGTSVYDVAAPFVPWALRQFSTGPISAGAVEELMNDELDRADAALLVDRSQTAIERQIDRNLVPYSFFGRIVLAPDAPPVSDDLRVRLFRSIFDVIALDRRDSNRSAVARACRSDGTPAADPVLAQLFALMDGGGARAVPYVVRLLVDADIQLRSQAAYLLLVWCQSLPAHAARMHRRSLADIVDAIDPSHPSLHLRFHQTEIVEAVLALASDETLRAAAAAVGRQLAAASESFQGAPGDSTASLHDVVGHLAAHVARSGQPTDGWRGGTQYVLTAIETGAWQTPTDASTPEMIDQRLECWEVALGSARRACILGGRQTRELERFVTSSLTHDLWIVRWWAFLNTLLLFDHAVEEGLSDTTRRLGTHLLDALFRPGEPMGLKHQQCASIEGVLQALTVSDAMRGQEVREFTRVLRVRASALLETTSLRRDFVRAYSDLLEDREPRAYLSHYFTQLRTLVGLSASLVEGTARPT